MSEQLYDAKIVGRQVIDQKKVYFASCNTHPLSETDFDRKINYLIERGNTTGKKVFDKLGFAVMWYPDIIVANMKQDYSTGFYNGGFNIQKHDITSGEYWNVDICELCNLDCEILGTESKIARNSQSIEDYLSKWAMQDRFKQKHGFKL